MVLALPLAAALQRMSDRQELLLRMVEEQLLHPPVTLPEQQPATATQVELQHRETVSLLMELLQETQPNPLEEIFRLSGPAPATNSLPSSDS